MMTKSSAGNYFEDFKLHQKIEHATPRTITAGDVAMYIGLTGSRFLLNSSVESAHAIGHKGQLVDDLLVFHVAFGKTVSDISVNAVANLGYADVRFIKPVYVGDTLTVHSTVIGLRENASGKSGIVYVESTALNQHQQTVISWKRWVMVHKNNTELAAVDAHIPDLPAQVDPDDWQMAKHLNFSHMETALSGSKALWGDYKIGERIDHLDGMTVDNSDHTLATKLYQNNARVHFDDVHMQGSAFKQRLMYGGHVISVCRALSFNGLQNALGLLAINGGSHVAPTFAGDTLYAVSDVLDVQDIPGRDDIAALRLKTWGLKNTAAAAVDQLYDSDLKKYHPAVVLALDYTVYMPK